MHLPADQAEKKIIDYLQSSLLGQIEQLIRDSLRAEVERVRETDKARTAQVEDLRAEIENLRGERMRLVRLAAATDDPVPEVVEALKTNHDRAKQLQDALDVATKPPLDAAQAERLEASAVRQVHRRRWGSQRIRFKR